MATTYFRIDPAAIGKGFITHADQEKSGLAFSITGDIAAVTGDEAAAAAWASRTGAAALDEKTAQADCAQYKSDGMKAEIAETETRLADLRARSTVLEAAAADLKAQVD